MLEEAYCLRPNDSYQEDEDRDSHGNKKVVDLWAHFNVGDATCLQFVKDLVILIQSQRIDR